MCRKRFWSCSVLLLLGCIKERRWESFEIVSRLRRRRYGRNFLMARWSIESRASTSICAIKCCIKSYAKCDGNSRRISRRTVGVATSSKPWKMRSKWKNKNSLSSAAFRPLWWHFGARIEGAAYGGSDSLSQRDRNWLSFSNAVELKAIFIYGLSSGYASPYSQSRLVN